jgi:hypothetical protein
MSMDEQNPNMRRLRFEWYAALATIIGKLLTQMPRATKVRGRYLCVAGTQVTRYVLAGDLMCRNLKDSRCVSLFSVTQDDGTILYQRQG